MHEQDPKDIINEINRQITLIIDNIEFEVRLIYEDEGDDPLTAYLYAKETWVEQVHIPSSKDEAIRILDNLESGELDKLGAKMNLSGLRGLSFF